MKISSFFRLPVFVISSLALLEVPALGAGLTVGPSQSIQIGIPGVTTNIPLDFVTIQAGGRVEIFGTVTLTVSGNVVIDGEVFSLPTAKLPEAEPGTDGQDAVTGQSGAFSGTLGAHGTNWVISSSVLTINSGADVFINGSILLRPKLDGGDGGRGGRGGNGAPGAYHLGNQGGGGNAGGLPGLVGALRIVARNRLELGEASVISLDNLGVGGAGGAGGDGGDGGPGVHGGEAQHGGDGGRGGPIGGGGPGSSGRSGGNLSLRADVLSLNGVISAAGSPGGKGGPAGRPSNGGRGGNAGFGVVNPPLRGGDGGNAGNWTALEYVNTGGRGGDGGNGGSVTLDARVLIDEGIINVSGGPGGRGGEGWEAGAGLGGLGGTPGGIKGLDSVEVPPGTNGVAGPPGMVLVRNPWAGVPGTRFFLPAFVDTSRNGTFGPAPGGGGGGGGPATYSVSAGSSDPFRIAAHVNLGSGSVDLLEMVLKYRWVSTSGSLDVNLGNTNLLHLNAPSTVSNSFSEVRVFITDPSLLSLFSQYLVLLLNPSPAAEIEIANFVLLTGSDDLRIGRSPAAPSRIDLSWFGFTNVTYQLQKRPFPAASGWTNLGASVLGQGSLITESQPLLPAPSNEFYRLSITGP